MSKGFIFEPKIHSYENIAKFLKSKGYEIEWDFKNNPLYPEYIKSGDDIVFFVKGKYIYIDKPLGGNLRPQAAVNKSYSLSPEWKEYIKLNTEYLGKKKVELRDSYEKAKKEYQEMCKENDKVYALLKRNFEYKEGDDEKEHIGQKEEKKGEGENKKGFFQKYLVNKMYV